jgi:putative ABC transport system ATP-binding protein
MNAIIETENLWKIYPMGTAEVCAVRDVTLRVTEGEFVALMGPSGSGKSSLMHLLGCLDTPTRGTYRLEGYLVGSLSAAEQARVRNERIAFIFQTFNLLPRRTALENVILPLYYRRGAKQNRGEMKTKGMAMLARVGLTPRATHRPVELSGGERQRVAIARALVGDPAIILADEPTGNLDVANGKEIMNLLVELSGEGRTILVVTHSVEVAAYARRRLNMVDGQIMTDETSGSGVR